jgi:hypothetical protein
MRRNSLTHPTRLCLPAPTTGDKNPCTESVYAEYCYVFNPYFPFLKHKSQAPTHHLHILHLTLSLSYLIFIIHLFLHTNHFKTKGTIIHLQKDNFYKTGLEALLVILISSTSPSLSKIQDDPDSDLLPKSLIGTRR